MLPVKTLLALMNFLQMVCAFIINVSAAIGRAIVLSMIFIAGRIQELYISAVMLAKNVQHLIVDFNASVAAVYDSICSNTNNGINCLLEAINNFFGKISYYTFTIGAYTNYWTTHIATNIIAFIIWVRCCLLLLADWFWWSLTIIPITMARILLITADAVVFVISGAGWILMSTIRLIIDDIFRLTTGVVLVCFLWHHKQNLFHFTVQFVLNLIECLRSFSFGRIIRMYRAHVRFEERRALARLNQNRNPNTNPNANNQQAVLSSRSSTYLEKLPDSLRCVVCKDQLKTVLLLPCKHMCLCKDCAEYMIFSARLNQCPLCRTKVLQSMAVYA